MFTRLFDYDLPPELIAQRPAARRDESRLMVLNRQTGGIEHKRFYDLPTLLEPKAVMVVNDARVIPGRLKLNKPTGGAVEITLIEKIAWSAGTESPRENVQRWRCLAKPARRLRVGAPLSPNGDLSVIPIERDGEAWIIEVRAEGEILQTLERVGKMPLPPYIRRREGESAGEDRERYQTVYAKEWGAVAAPTAGLHFTPELLEGIRRRGIAIAHVTLDVGWGSFAPVREEIAEDHRVAAERFRVGEECAKAVNAARSSGGKVVAVGTTSVRALESAWGNDGLEPAEGKTVLFITPGYRFKAVDALITNFHLPRSSLIMLAAAFAGLPQLLAAYREAVRERYRFYSYGDAMLII